MDQNRMWEFLKNKEKDLEISLFHTPVYQKSWWFDLQFLWYWVWQTEISNYGSLFTLLPPNIPENKTKNKKILKNWKKHLEIWCMLPEIRSVTDIIFCHFGPYFALLTHYSP